MTPPRSRYRFGSFRFDAGSGELSNGGAVTRLAPQTAALLVVLLDRAGDVVPRSLLQRELWPDSHVEFDQGLNFCVRQLRVALGDNADAPTFIETLPRRGYRFLVTAERDGVVADQTSRPDVVASPLANAPAPAATGRRRRPALISLTVAALAAVTALWAIRLASPAAEQSASTAVLAILPFDATGTDTVATRYRARLAEDLVVRLTAASRATNVLGPTSTSAFDTRTPLADLRERLSATYVLSGTATADSAAVRLFAQLIRTADGRHVWARRFVDSTASTSTRTMDSLGAAITQAVVAAMGDVAR